MLRSTKFKTCVNLLRVCALSNHCSPTLRCHPRIRSVRSVAPSLSLPYLHLANISLAVTVSCSTWWTQRSVSIVRPPFRRFKPWTVLSSTQIQNQFKRRFPKLSNCHRTNVLKETHTQQQILVIRNFTKPIDIFVSLPHFLLFSDFCDKLRSNSISFNDNKYQKEN